MEKGVVTEKPVKGEEVTAMENSMEEVMATIAKKTT